MDFLGLAFIFDFLVTFRKRKEFNLLVFCNMVTISLTVKVCNISWVKSLKRLDGNIISFLYKS